MPIAILNIRFVKYLILILAVFDNLIDYKLKERTFIQYLNVCLPTLIY